MKEDIICMMRELLTILPLNRPTRD